MGKSARLAFLAVLLCGLVVIVAIAATTKREDQQRLGVLASMSVAALKAGDVVCQRRIGLAGPVSRVGFDAAAARGPSPPLELWIRRNDDRRRILARSRLNRGWGAGALVMRLDDRVDTRDFIDVCFRNTGPYRVDFLGDAPGRFAHVAPASPMSINGKDVIGDLSLRFVRDKPASVLSLVPEIVRRAAAYRPFGAWGMWILLAAILGALPWLLWRAAGAAGSGEAGAPLGHREPDPL